MSDDGHRDKWKERAAGHDRLRWARKHWQLQTGAISHTPTEAARLLGWKPNTYLSYERDPTSSKHTPLDHQAAIELARRFHINWKWLLLGEGTPFDDDLPEPQARVVEAMSKASLDEQHRLADMIEAFMKSRRAS